MATMTTVNSPKPTPGVPLTQNTAPIFDFTCLYTHDLRRKQKRWQDGFLRFHTFNKRIMVYDMPRNFIGDTHWRGSGSVNEGDELELDRGVMVEVGEAVGSTQQDISGIIEKRPKAPFVAVDAQQQPRPPITALNSASPQQLLRPKPLNTVLGPPRGAIGRAILSTKSPFEERHEARQHAWQGNGQSKRQKISHATAESPTTQCPTVESEGRLIKEAQRMSIPRPLTITPLPSAQRQAQAKAAKAIPPAGMRVNSAALSLTSNRSIRSAAPESRRTTHNQDHPDTERPGLEQETPFAEDDEPRGRIVIRARKPRVKMLYREEPVPVRAATDQTRSKRKHEDSNKDSNSQGRSVPRGRRPLRANSSRADSAHSIDVRANSSDFETDSIVLVESSPNKANAAAQSQAAASRQGADRRSTEAAENRLATTTAGQPWSVEAWDLFGCHPRTGQKCSFAEFLDDSSP